MEAAVDVLVLRVFAPKFLTLRKEKGKEKKNISDFDIEIALPCDPEEVVLPPELDDPCIKQILRHVVRSLTSIPKLPLRRCAGSVDFLDQVFHHVIEFLRIWPQTALPHAKEKFPLF